MEQEELFIKEHIEHPLCMNLSSSSAGARDYKHTDKAKEKISLASKTSTKWNKGLKATDSRISSSIEAMRKANLGRIMDEEAKTKLKNARILYWKNKSDRRQTVDDRAKKSIAAKARWERYRNQKQREIA